MLNPKHIPHITWTAANINSFPLQLLHCCNWADTGWGFLQRPIFQLKFNFQVKGFIQSQTVHAPHCCTVSQHEISWFIISRTVQGGRGKAKEIKAGWCFSKLGLFQVQEEAAIPVSICRWAVRLVWHTTVGLTRRNHSAWFSSRVETNGKKSYQEHMRGVSQAKWELLF